MGFLGGIWIWDLDPGKWFDALSRTILMNHPITILEDSSAESYPKGEGPGGFRAEQY